MITRRIGGRRNSTPTYTTTTITSSQTYEATKTGVHRFMLLGTGATGCPGSGSGSGGGGACPVPLYLEFTLTAGQEVPIVINAPPTAATASSVEGRYGNTATITVSGTTYATIPAPPGAVLIGPIRQGGRGWATAGRDGTAPTNLEAGLLAYLSARFPDVALTQGTDSNTAESGAPGLLIDAAGPSASGDTGSGYGAGSGSGSGVATETPNAGVVLVGVPG